ncbi:MAG: hypothetical protein R2824_29640 [Saprospiraceae bacterium]
MCTNFKYSKRLILSGSFLILLLGCGPEKEFQKAEETRSIEAFQAFIKRYPEHDLSQTAHMRIHEINSWFRIDSSFAETDYQLYLDSFPSSLFFNEVEERLVDLEFFRYISGIDLIEKYQLYKDSISSSFIVDSIHSRIEELAPAYESYILLNKDTNITALQTFLKQFPNNGYSRLMEVNLDSIAIIKAIERVFSKRIYKDLPNNVDSLTELISTQAKNQKVRFAKQALEDVIIERIRITGSLDRFVIPGIKVVSKGSWNNFRYSIRSIKSPRTVITKINTTSQSFSMDLSASSVAKEAMVYTDYPSDGIPIHLPEIYPNMIFNGKGEAPLALINMVHEHVWRFSGKVEISDSLIISGFPDDPISFLLIENVGPIYIHGKGTVEQSNGVVLYSNID